MAQYRLSTAAQADLVDILAWSQQRFGVPARMRYQALIATALRDLAAQPCRAGSMERPELGDGVRSWHLRLSRDRARTATGIVRHPRHFLIYRMHGEQLVIGRMLHDAMELERHLAFDSPWDEG